MAKGTKLTGALAVLAGVGLFTSGAQAGDKPVVDVPFTKQAITIDGVDDEKAWASVEWAQMNHHIIGEMPSSPADFTGRYKLLWDNEFLYVMAEITDDVLFDKEPDPLKFYWDDDCLEIFIDEDASGGEHQTNYNAFAYHVALDNQSVDIGKPNADGSPNFVLLNDHVVSNWKRKKDAPHTIIWETAVRIFPDTFDDKDPAGFHKPVTLDAGKVLGFMLAYCDNDGSEQREHFWGSHAIAPVNGDKNLGYKTADVFGNIKLIK